ncbi:hypothetical protein BTURTLESOX_1754 [bacterium endosymbiont of Bathymodiolus sp. 5 South]|nr:hypothetical protein [uncultured Gammaproteobacteria bacterium]SHN89577.1 hypothetical protein BCLUESOX_1440 [bacterium endosymbiont of Bathymodiolus sp. 5 South]CAC9658232.1 hypothetical protein [uncultured Gammaproteobacteria bacterium]SSC09002.1 hypothetical protein BTURTLESOX_1754 [bacterium endosymbiont of Bathymodiolus sp. 5 South]VVH58561.1 hypothetical protein BSPCLSOX_2274 [uncultured Gammaproteobacteria bacterium]
MIDFLSIGTALKPIMLNVRGILIVSFVKEIISVRVLFFIKTS